MLTSQTFELKFVGSERNQGTPDVEAELLCAVDAKLKERPELQYYEALKLVASEDRDLARRYDLEARRRMRSVY